MYEPLADAIEELQRNINKYESGYVTLFGPPGSGKSTLLCQVLEPSVDRIIHYYAFVPGTVPKRPRMTGNAFLHDLVLLLSRSGLSSRFQQLVSDDVNELHHQLADQLAGC